MGLVQKKLEKHKNILTKNRIKKNRIKRNILKVSTTLIIVSGISFVSYDKHHLAKSYNSKLNELHQYYDSEQVFLQKDVKQQRVESVSQLHSGLIFKGKTKQTSLNQVKEDILIKKHDTDLLKKIYGNDFVLSDTGAVWQIHQDVTLQEIEDVNNQLYPQKGLNSRYIKVRQRYIENAKNQANRILEIQSMIDNIKKNLEDAKSNSQKLPELEKQIKQLKDSLSQIEAQQFQRDIQNIQDQVIELNNHYEKVADDTTEQVISLEDEVLVNSNATVDVESTSTINLDNEPSTIEANSEHHDHSSSTSIVNSTETDNGDYIEIQETETDNGDYIEIQETQTDNGANLEIHETQPDFIHFDYVGVVDNNTPLGDGIYEFDLVKNWFLAERVQPVGEQVRSLSIGSRITIGGIPYVVNHIIRGYENIPRYTTEWEDLRDTHGDAVLQTCESSYVNSTLSLYCLSAI